MYLKFNGDPIAETGPTDGAQLWGQPSAETLTGTDGNDILNGQGGDTLRGGRGDDTYYLNSDGNTVQEAPGEGIDTVSTFMSYALPDNVENLTVSGDGLTATGNNLDNLIKVGDGRNMTLFGGRGNDVLVGGAGNDTFVVQADGGTAAIYNWHAGDKLRLIGSPLHTFGDVQAAMRQVGADVVIQDLIDHIVIRNTQISQLSAADFDLGVTQSALGALTFDDEFNALNLWNGATNPHGVWTDYYGQAGIGNLGSYTLTSNGEQQVYVGPDFQGASDHNLNEMPFAFFAPGVLTIRAQAVDPSPDNWNYGYTSGVLTTKNSFSQTYGYFEIRAKLPDHEAGAWPAFWLVPADGSWPPELDVMEERGDNASQVFVTAHSQAGGEHTAVGSPVLVGPSGDGFHTYGVMWTPTDLTWYVDGSQVFHTATPADMNKPMYMIVNLAVGGFGGDPHGWAAADMQIDYVHAYALPGQGGATAAAAAPAPAPAPPADAAIVDTAASSFDWNSSWYF
ncbi:MAG: endo,3,4-beta-glycanase, C-terminal secretion signal protein [Caulobacteraceae bacterium]|nr:endo,3,4-beta-glycanase, C-terminal secretion signal protein [Caulobacteraceae bacterium]